jgi:hypothetical protein
MLNKKTFAALITAPFLSITIASETAVSQDQTANSDKEDVEQIQVYGQRPPGYYKELMIQAELAFFDTYNQLTENEDFKIICSREPIGPFSRLTKRVCEPGYIDEEQFKGTQEAFSAVSLRNKAIGNLTHTPGDLRIRKAQKKQREAQLEELRELVKTNPELQKKLINLNRAKAKYTASKGDSDE